MRERTIPSPRHVRQWPPDLKRPLMLKRFFKRRVGWMLVRNTVVSTGVFLLGLLVLWGMVEQAGVDPVVATALSFILSNSIHYVLGRTWIFAGTDRAVASGYALFLANAMVGLAVTVSLFWLLTTFTPMHYLVARVLVSVFAGLAMFALNATINFRQV